MFVVILVCVVVNVVDECHNRILLNTKKPHMHEQ